MTHIIDENIYLLFHTYIRNRLFVIMKNVDKMNVYCFFLQICFIIELLLFRNGANKRMTLLYKGKTKDVYEHTKNQVRLQFKDDVTGEDGVFDPGANTVGATIEGAGKSGLRVTTYFFELLNTNGIPTHFISSSIDESTMIVKKATMFGNGLEVICRYRAVGSFYRRYGAYCEEGEILPAITEITLKDDERNDPPISKETLVALNIVSEETYHEIIDRTKQITALVHEACAKHGLELYDIKLEFGQDPETGKLMLIDEISGGNMRLYAKDEYVEPLELEHYLLSE